MNRNTPTSDEGAGSETKRPRWQSRQSKHRDAGSKDRKEDSEEKLQDEIKQGYLAYSKTEPKRAK